MSLAPKPDIAAAATDFTHLDTLEKVGLLRHVKQHPYLSPNRQNTQANAELLLELLELKQKIIYQELSVATAITNFDSLLGLRSDNFLSFKNAFCSPLPEFWQETLNTLYAIATRICQSPQPQDSSENDNDPDAQNTNPIDSRSQGILRAAEFLAPYVLVSDENQNAFFPPRGQISFRFTSIPIPNNDGARIYASLQTQIKELVEGHYSIYTEPQYSDNPYSGEIVARDVYYQSAFAIDASWAPAQAARLLNSQIALSSHYEMDEDLTEKVNFFSDATLPSSRYFAEWSVHTPIDDIGVIVQTPNEFNPTLVSARVFNDTTYPATLTIFDVYGDEHVFNTEIMVRNTINEAPQPEITGPKDNQVWASATISCTLAKTGDPNRLDEGHHIVKWEAKIGKMVFAHGEGEAFTFLAPDFDTKVRVTVTVDDQHVTVGEQSANNIGEKTEIITVQTRPEDAPKRKRDNQMEIDQVARILRSPIIKLGKDGLSDSLPQTVIEAVKIDDTAKPKTYDLLFLVDQSGSMGVNLSYLFPEIHAVLEELQNQIEPDGEIRISIATYGNSTTTIHYRSNWQAFSDPSELDLFSEELENEVLNVIDFIAKNNLNQETLWYSIWDLWEGENKQDWGIEDNGSEVRFIVLTDEVVKDEENVVKVPKRKKPFDQHDAEAFADRHHMSLRIIQMQNIELSVADILKMLDEPQLVSMVLPKIQLSHMTPAVEQRLHELVIFYKNDLSMLHLLLDTIFNDPKSDLAQEWEQNLIGMLKGTDIKLINFALTEFAGLRNPHTNVKRIVANAIPKLGKDWQAIGTAISIICNGKKDDAETLAIFADLMTGPLADQILEAMPQKTPAPPKTLRRLEADPGYGVLLTLAPYIKDPSLKNKLIAQIKADCKLGSNRLSEMYFQISTSGPEQVTQVSAPKSTRNWIDHNHLVTILSLLEANPKDPEIAAILVGVVENKDEKENAQDISVALKMLANSSMQTTITPVLSQKIWQYIQATNDIFEATLQLSLFADLGNPPPTVDEFIKMKSVNSVGNISKMLTEICQRHPEWLDLVAQLVHSADPLAQAIGLNTISELGPSILEYHDVIPDVLAIAKDTANKNYRAGIEALHKMGKQAAENPDVFAFLLAALKDRDLAIEVVFVLEDFAPWLKDKTRIYPALLVATKLVVTNLEEGYYDYKIDAPAYVVKSFFTAMQIYAPAEAQPQLINNLERYIKSTGWGVGLMAAKTILTIYPSHPAALAKLHQGIVSSGADWDIALELCRLDPAHVDLASVIPALIEPLQYDDRFDSKEKYILALKSLYQHHDHKVIDKIVLSFLHDSDYNLRLAAIKAVVALKILNAANDLEDMAQNDIAPVRRAAAAALIQF